MNGTQEKPQRLVKSFESLGRDYYGGEWPGTDRVVEELSKALATGAPSALSGFGDATPLRLENLDSTMTAVLFQEAHLKIFSAMPRVPSVQPLFQWMREKSYGSERGSVGFREGGAPQVGVSVWERGTILNKYMGVRRGYTHQMLITGQLGGTFVDPVARENRNGTRQLLAMIERQIMWGLKSLKDSSANEIHYDGIVAQMEASSFATTNIIDMAGKPLDFETLEDIGEKLVTKAKLLNFDALRTFWKPKALSDLAKLKVQAERRLLGNDNVAGYRPGAPLAGYNTQHGYMPFEESIFLDAVEDGKPLYTTADPGSLAAPGAPSVVVASDATSLMETGTDYYSVSTINDAGESLTVQTTAVSSLAGNKNTVTITKVTNATGYRIYRGKASDGSDAYLVGTVAQPAGATVDFVDKNSWRPGLGMGVILHLREEDVALAQMAPLIKFPLAIVNTTIEFLLLLYHVIAVKAPERVYIVKNIGARV